MTLDVEAPAPPSLEPAATTPDGVDYRRPELEEFLEGGAWAEAFERWAAETDLAESEWRIVRELGLVEGFDFFWDDIAGRVGYNTPGVPEDWRERELHPELDSWETASGINAAMAELGSTVGDVLGEGYVDWESEGPDADDLPDF
jgi:hypothetical protein